MHTHISDWDMTHNVAEPLLHSPQDVALIGAKHAYQTLRAGFTTVHAHGAKGIKAAIRAGVKSVEHVSLLDDEGIKMAKEKGTYLVMDIYNGDYIDEVGRKENWPEEYLRKNTETTETTETTDVQRQAFREAVKAGVKIAYGTDAGGYPIGTNAKQFAYMVKFGMMPMQAIQSASVVAADLLNWQEDVGAVSAGRCADMIAVDGDPIADISVLETLPVVMKGGAIVPSDLSIRQ